jgi:hypothetical protein
MAGLCFYFEDADVDVWSGKNLDAWNYAAKAAGDIDRMIVINRTDQLISPPDADLTQFEVLSELPSLERAVYLVGPSQAGLDAASLWSFDHDVDWYVFGPASGWEPGHPRLHVPQAGIGALHAVHIASVVMLHRYHVRGV